MDRLFYITLPFRVWNHMLYCMRSEYCLNMCLLCTRIYVPEKRYLIIQINICMFLLINFILRLEMALFLQTRYFFFAHNNASVKKDDLRERAKRNIGVLYYECISSPFLLFKMYLDTLC